MDRRAWQQLVERFESSGLTQQEFADNKGIKVGTFRSWLYRLRREDIVTAPLEFVEVETRQKIATSRGGAACRVVSGDAAIELAELPPTEWLAELVGALGQARC